MTTFTVPAGVRRRLGALAAALALTAITAHPAAAAPAAPPTALSPASIDRYVRDYLARTNLPGAVVAVTKGDRVVHTAGYGRTAAGQPMTARTRMPVASLSKSMTALAVMQLVEAGRIELDRPVHRYLPEFTMADRRAEGITVRQLLTQTSGMADSAYPDLTRAQPGTLKEAVAALRGAQLATTPGTTFAYHNPNYFVAARLVEVVSATPFADYLSRHLFQPLGMTHSTSVNTTADMPEQARGHVRAYGTTLVLPHPRWFTAGGHGVVTTADDLSRWLVFQNDRGAPVGGHRIATAATLALTHTPPDVPKDSSYAMGWQRSRDDGGPEQIRHTGELLTHNAMATLLPDSGIGIAVVTNTGMVSGDDAPQLAEGSGRLPVVWPKLPFDGRWPSVGLAAAGPHPRPVPALGAAGCVGAVPCRSSEPRAGRGAPHQPNGLVSMARKAPGAVPPVAAGSLCYACPNWPHCWAWLA
ncbi:serine hydrolase [Streptomyces noursei]|uniref:serine hydrolase domain-containing protein n=1 Tax=Streptomyces noursei TaxID=1971 RepID=UPI0021A71AA1|nr:serine hydrolase domain-containing protein [Streptomyces noursei]UWS70048.1 beta-lactamase family protein [Streptomyces noursei]